MGLDRSRVSGPSGPPEPEPEQKPQMIRMHREVRGSALDDSWTNLKACFIISYPKSFKSYPLKTDLLHTASSL